MAKAWFEATVAKRFKGVINDNRLVLHEGESFLSENMVNMGSCIWTAAAVVHYFGQFREAAFETWQKAFRRRKRKS